MTRSELSSRKAYVIGQLRGMGIHKAKCGTPVELMGYRELKYLLAVKQAMKQ